ncbi:MAG: transglycosylase SLT domain-containing protein [Proteobacteria bacterium]|jgi:hypothetical protein|nr:transglycosylase SLT domain-containing protein [Pseudomonadota bacterium]
MKKFLMLFLIILSGCVTDRNFNQSNLCDIFQTNPQWKSYAEKTKDKWGVPVSLQLSFIKQESSFNRTARPPRQKVLGLIPGLRPSSAYGYSQALDGTWEEYKQSTGNYNADRKNFADASDFIGWYVDGSYRLLKIEKTDVYNHYLAYHEGKGGFQKKSYNKKKWLLDVAKKVENQAKEYSDQIKKCNFHKNSVF